jgi:hypothetical protein
MGMVNKRVIVVVSVLLLLVGRSSLRSAGCNRSRIHSHGVCNLTAHAQPPSTAHTLLEDCFLDAAMVFACTRLNDIKAEQLKASPSETSNRNVVALYPGNL